MVHHFSGPEAQESIHEAIRLYAQGKWRREKMMTHVAEILDSCGVTQMTVRNYTVRNTLPLETSAGTFQVIIIEAPGKIHKACPACGEDEWGYLASEAPVAKAWCLGCSCIYRREVQDEKVNAGGNGLGVGRRGN